jgi:hypothetical protein
MPSKINRLLDELFGDPEGAFLDEAEGVVLTLYAEGRGRTPTMPSCSLLKAAYLSHNRRSVTIVLP